MSTIINATTTNGVVIQPDNSGSLALQTNNGTTALTIDTSQNVGIGTSTFNGVRSVIQGSQTGGAPQTSGTTQTYGLLRLKGSTFTSALDFGTNGGDYAWIQSTDTTNLATNYSLVLNPNGGNVGIGTSSPAHKLDVAGSLRLASVADILANTTGAGSIAISAGTSYNAGGTIVFRGSTNATNPYGLEFNTNGTERMRIDSSGRVLYKTTSAPVNFSMFRAVGASCDFSFGPQDQAGQTSFSVWNASTVGVYLVSGNTSWTGTSDGTLKNVTSKVTDGLNKVISMNPVYYSWKESEDNKQHIGFIAQEMEKIEPTVVEQNGGLYGINYTELIPVLTAAIQEQQTIINDLKARVETLEAK